MGGRSSGNNWCSTASINPTSGSIDINRILGYGDEDSSIKTIAGRSFDITSNAEWMEYIENHEDRVDVEGGAGAYDVMRCDLEYRPSEDHHPMDPNWRVWGEDFHLSRLRTSFCSLLDHMTEVDANGEEIDHALAISREMTRALLMEAHSSEIMQSLAPPHESEVHDVTIQLVKLTILWTPKPNVKDDLIGNQTIIVRGHACSSCSPMPIHKRPSPIIATIALPLRKRTEIKVADIEDTLPSRFRSPQSKVASWCRLRRPLEDPETYKPPGVGEVLMVRSTSASQSEYDANNEILEGLTSNFFVIYKDGTLRTPEKGVLAGYVRHVVLACAQRAGLVLDYSPILMDDASKGLWESAFITSSSRLLYPISRILIPKISEDDSDDKSSGIVFVEFWVDSHLVEGNDGASTPRWLNLLNEVLHEGGYEKMTNE
jgi:hypothetical protein